MAAHAVADMRGAKEEPLSQIILAVGFGIVTAAALACGAVGFTLQFGVSSIFNLAFGDIMTIGGFTAYVANQQGVGIWWSCACGAAAGAVLSFLLSRFVFAPFMRRGSSQFALVMLSLAVAVVLRNGLQMIAGSGYRAYRLSTERPYHVLGALFTPRELAAIAIAAASMLLVYLLLQHSHLGSGIRALADDPELARLCGVKTARVRDAAWLISGALAGLSGVLLAIQLANFDFTYGGSFLLTIVAAAVFGSIGQPYGAMAGAVIIAVATEIAAIWVPSIKDVVAFALLVVILLARPSGLFSRQLAPGVETVR